jgi:hypothetical protein
MVSIWLHVLLLAVLVSVGAIGQTAAASPCDGAKHPIIILPGEPICRVFVIHVSAACDSLDHTSGGCPACAVSSNSSTCWGSIRVKQQRQSCVMVVVCHVYIYTNVSRHIISPYFDVL